MLRSLPLLTHPHEVASRHAHPNLVGYSRPQNAARFATTCWQINWEVAIKHAKGLLNLGPDLLDQGARENGLRHLAFHSLHAQQVGGLPDHHQDPFDRALIAQAMCEPLTLVSRDRWFASYPVSLRQV